MSRNPRKEAPQGGAEAGFQETGRWEALGREFDEKSPEKMKNQAEIAKYLLKMANFSRISQWLSQQKDSRA